MKNLRLTIFIFFFLHIVVVQAQTRNCATMDYYEMRKNQDPEAEKRMEESEKKVQDWIAKNPQKINDEPVILFPTIAGFTPTGNVELDRINYASAKQKLGGSNPKLKVHNESERKVLLDKKRKEHKMILKNN